MKTLSLFRYNVSREDEGGEVMEENTNPLAMGMVWGTTLSIPLWIAFFGWIKLLSQLFL
jgi:hypothetical protein